MSGGIIGKVAHLVKGTKKPNKKTRKAKMQVKQDERGSKGKLVHKKPRGKQRKAGLERMRKLDDPNLPF